MNKSINWKKPFRIVRWSFSPLPVRDFLSVRSLSRYLHARSVGHSAESDRVENSSLVSKSSRQGKREGRRCPRLLNGSICLQWRKMENTRKGPGRPPSNAQLNSCSGEPISAEELERRRSLAEERKRRKTKKNISSSTTDDSNCSASPPPLQPPTHSSSYSIERILFQSTKKSS